MEDVRRSQSTLPVDFDSVTDSSEEYYSSAVLKWSKLGLYLPWSCFGPQRAFLRRTAGKGIFGTESTRFVLRFECLRGS